MTDYSVTITQRPLGFKVSYYERAGIMLLFCIWHILFIRGSSDVCTSIMNVLRKLDKHLSEEIHLTAIPYILEIDFAVCEAIVNEVI